MKKLIIGLALLCGSIIAFGQEKTLSGDIVIETAESRVNIIDLNVNASDNAVDIGILLDSIRAIRTELVSVKRKITLDTITVNAAEDTVFLYYTGELGQYRIPLAIGTDTSPADDNTKPIFVSAVIEDENDNTIVITMSESILDSITASGGIVWSGVDRWWSLGEASGTLVDSVSADNATNTGATYGATGKVGDALDFEETEDDYLTLSTGFNYADQDFSVTMWVNPESITASHSVMGGGTGAFFFDINPDGSLSIGKVNVSEGTATSITVSTGSLQFIGMSYDQSADTVHYRINTSTEGETFTHEFSANTTYIGAREQTSFSYDGIMCSVNVWDHLLTDTEWDSLYNGGAGHAYTTDANSQDSIIEAFTVLVDDVEKTVSAVSVNNRNVSVDLAAPVTYGDTVTIAYDKPVSYGLRDTSNNYVDSWTAENVANQVDSSENFIIYHTWDFETETEGAFIEDSIKDYFGTEGVDWDRLYDKNQYTQQWYIVSDSINATKNLQFKHPQGDEAAYAGGNYSKEITLLLDSAFTEVYASWDYQPGIAWNAAQEGKLPGLRCAQEADPNEDFVMSSGDGFIYMTNFKFGGTYIPYIYDFTNSSVPRNGDTQDSVQFSPGTSYRITQRLVLNTFVDGVAQHDGLLEIWIDGHVAYQQTGLRMTIDDDANHKIDAFLLNTFYGPSKGGPEAGDCYNYFDNIQIWLPINDDTKGTHTLHAVADSLVVPNPITSEPFYYGTFIDNAATDLTTGGALGIGTNRMWLIDAGAGNTVEVDFDSGVVGSKTWLRFYDGKYSNAEAIEMVFEDSNLGDNWGTSGVVQSTGRYMFVVVMTSEFDSSTNFTGNITFN